MHFRPRALTWAVAALLATGAGAAAQFTPPTPAKATAPAEPGIPVTSDTVKKACSACHQPDERGCLTRISYRRTTPEGWQETIKRMATLNGAPIDPTTARAVLRYLANEQGLAPEEARPAAFESERRIIEYEYANKDTEKVCGACHSVGRPMLQRRTKEEWDLLAAMHRGYYPLVDFQAFRTGRPPASEVGPDGKPPDRRQPVDKALDYLKAAYPLQTPEWSAWTANRRPARLAGRWALSGREPGRGFVFGEVTIAPKAGSDDEFTTEARYAYAKGGAAVQRKGQAIVYTSFQWRGRTSTGDGDKEPLREVMFVERDGRTMSGRWFTGAYDEKGLDVVLRKIGADPVVLGAVPRALRTGTSASVRVYGANLPASLAPADVDFGRGVRVTRVAPAEGGVAVDLEVASDAPVGARDVLVAGAAAPAAAVVFSTVDSLKVTPQAGMARVGGIQFPKGYQQFEATAYSNGADGKRDTKDDLDLGPVDVAWSIEEFTATIGDDDKAWAGKIDAAGLFTPAEDGPNPKRKGNRNNVGDLWVVASLAPTSALHPAAPLRARAHLIVTVPLYARWDQPEVAP
jgi:quinohemoprotein amine dehydrogenase